MIYFLLGEDMAAKDAKVAAWKKEYIAPAESQEFDYEVLYGTKCDPAALKKSLIALPGLAKKRLILVRDAHKLSEHNQTILKEFASSNHDHAVVIIESGQWEATNAFVKSLKIAAKIVDTGRAAKPNVFDMTRLIGQQRPGEALKVLGDLIFDGVHPLQIMGGLVWFWSSERPRMSPARFEKGLLALEEADLNIKRSRLKPEQAVELLVVKLCTLN